VSEQRPPDQPPQQQPERPGAGGTTPGGRAPAGPAETGGGQAGTTATSGSPSASTLREGALTPAENRPPATGPSAGAGAPPGMAGATGSPAPPAPPDADSVTITVDGREVRARKGEMIIAAADRAGVYIPRFCYHPRMRPVGMCRMCLVDVKGPRGFALAPACFNPVADGQEVVTNSDKVKKAQDQILEFLLINHPLDCPVCDKGGECPLQDQTLAYGPGESRFVEEKRHWDKPISLSALVSLDRERCIQCARCTRFSEEVAGDPLIDFAGRGDMTEVATFPDAPFASYFSGNTVQICPVGALTSTPYRFRARPWDLEQVESTCTSCAVGCRVAVQSSSDELTRYIGVDSDPVNWGWLCDKGRFDHEAVNSAERLGQPLVRKDGELVEVSWAEALSTAAAALAAAARPGGGGTPWDGRRLGVIGGARLPNEDAYLWSRVARAALLTDNVDCQLGDGLDPRSLLGLPRATIDEAAGAPLVILLAPDIKEELPVLYLRLRHAAVTDGVPVVELSPRRTGFSRYADRTLVYRPGHAGELTRALTGSTPVDGDVAGVAAGLITDARARISEAMEKGRPGAPSIVVVLGRPTVAEPESAISEAAAALGRLPGVAFLAALRRSNVHGALDMGLAPGTLPGRVPLEGGRRWYEGHWEARLPERPGMDTRDMLEAAAAGEMGALVLLGADPVADFPDHALAAEAMGRAGFVVAVDTFLNASNRDADVILPAAGYAERRGTFTNLEGRISWLGQKVTAPGVAWPDWMIASELASELGYDCGVASVEDIWTEIEALSPLHRGATWEIITSREGRDGVVVPVRPGTAAGPRLPRPLDPMADPGIASAETHMTPPNLLSGSGAGRRFAAGAAPGRPEAEVEGRRNAGADGREPGPAGLIPGDPDAGGRPGPWQPSPVLIGSPGATDLGLARPADRPPTMGPYEAPATNPPAPPAAGTLRLVATRKMWDGGTLLAHSPHLADLHPEPAVYLHPATLAALGIAGGTEVWVDSGRGRMRLPAVADAGVARDGAAIVLNVPGANPATLLDAGRPVTDVTVTPVGAA
jgi:NADH-quinone oxidoreductase subunit G